ncbi:hypothetical protein DFH06DRAFT_768830 [Mycena polygramma]|nr:hypothetical protein DFH06DRAFT_768830 [Mycena polygramma]
MLSLSSTPLFVLLVVVFWSTLVNAHPWTPGPRILGKRDAFSDSGLALASWIWLPEPDLLTTAPAGEVAFIKAFPSPTGKTAASALVAMTADNNFTLYVNGQPIGAGSAWQTAQVFSVALNGSTNMFSVRGVNSALGAPASANPAGLLAAIRIHYSDGSNDTVISDNTWVVSGAVPADFPLPADLSPFVPAQVVVKYGSGVWGTSVGVPSPNPNPLDLSTSSWIWSTSNSGPNAPVGTVGFRKTTVAPSGKSASSATVILSVDNSFELYLNGQYIGSPPYDNNAPASTGSWEYAQRFNVALAPSTNVFTVLATNFAPQQAGGTSGAGFIAALQIEYADGSSEIVRSDATWLTGPAASASAFVTTPDSALGQSISQGQYGMAPWGQIGVSDALNVLMLPGNHAAIVSPTSPSETPEPFPAPTSMLPVPTLTSSNLPTSSPSAGGARTNVNGCIAPMLIFALSFMCMAVF